MGSVVITLLAVHSLKLTANCPENRPSQKETIVFQPSISRGYVSFREGIYRLYTRRKKALPSFGGYVIPATYYQNQNNLLIQGIYRGIAGWCWFNVAFILRRSWLGRVAHHWVPDARSTVCQRTLLGGKTAKGMVVLFSSRGFGVVLCLVNQPPPNVPLPEIRP